MIVFNVEVANSIRGCMVDDEEKQPIDLECLDIGENLLLCLIKK